MNPTQLSLDAAAEAAAMISIDELPLPYLEIDMRGIITRANRAALAIYPPEQGELVGQLAFSLLAGRDRKLSLQSFTAMLQSGGEEPSAVIRYLYDQSRRYSAYQLYRSVMRDAAGKPSGMRIVCVNVAETTQALEETRRRNLWLESVLHSLPEALIVTDATGVITDVNPAAEELLGWKAAELVGKVIEEGLQWRSLASSVKSRTTFLTELTSECNGFSTLVDHDGREIVVRVWSSPILDKQTGSIAGIVLVLYKPGNAFTVPR